MAQRIVSASKPMDLPLAMPLYDSGGPPQHAYFLTSGIASLVFTSLHGNSIELATTGREGVAGGTFLLVDQQPIGSCTIQLAGTGLRTPLAVLEQEFKQAPEFRFRLLDYMQHQLNLAHQVTACNRLHRAEARFARWMLMVQDRMGTETLPMTQEFMADMLGTRRTTVAEVAAHLQRAGCIEYRRGVVRITHRAELEEHACECYRLLRDRYDRLYSAPLPA